MNGSNYNKYYYSNNNSIITENIKHSQNISYSET